MNRPSRSVYNTVYISIPGDPLYFGCFDGASIDSNVTHLDFSNNTRDACRLHCAFTGFTFTGVINGSQCLCTQYVEDFGNITNNINCDVPCSGDDVFFCGGKEDYSVSIAQSEPLLIYVYDITLNN